MIITKTPFRISFFGGGTDYPSHYRSHGGAVLGTTIDRYCWISVRPTNPFGPKYKIVYSRVEECSSLGEIQHSAVRECLRFLDVHDVEIHHWSDLPARSGVGSSSAFVVGLLNALHEYVGSCVSRGAIAEQAIKIERDVLNETVGCQDQYLTSYGGFCYIEFPADSFFPTVEMQGGPEEVYPVPVRQLREHLLLFYTGIQRTSSDVAAEYVKNFAKNERVLSQMVCMAEEGKHLLRRGEFRRFGELLHQAWESKKSLGEGVSGVGINALYAAAREAGALGGKILGAGGGGFLLLFAPPEKQEAVRAALAKLTEVKFKFESEGSVVVLGGNR